MQATDAASCPASCCPAPSAAAAASAGAGGGAGAVGQGAGGCEEQVQARTCTSAPRSPTWRRPACRIAAAVAAAAAAAAALACEAHDCGVAERQDEHRWRVQRAVLMRHDALTGLVCSGTSRPERRRGAP